MLNEKTEMRILGGALFGMLLVLGLALPAHASHEQECEDDATCIYNEDPITNTATTGAITNTLTGGASTASTGAVTNTLTGGATTVTTGANTLTGGATTVTTGAVTVEGSGATIGDINANAVVGDVEASVGDVTGGSVGDIDNSSGAAAEGGDAEGGDGGAGGNVNFKYPKQPVSSPAMALGGTCSQSASISTRDVALSVGSGDPLCRQMELVKMALLLERKTEAVEHYQTAVTMEKRNNWFRGSRLGGFLRGFPVLGIVFRLF